jgi:endonuclease/exonuclease/phosphatase family metal-dependent hydrolase
VPRILTYNVRHCLGIDGQLSPERIAEVIASCEPDVVALQELDVNRARTGGIDQARTIAGELDMDLHILTAHPCALVKAELLSDWRWRGLGEPRGALWVSVDIGGTGIQVINTHLGMLEAVRLRQIDALLGPDWLGHAGCREPVILTGDFNAVPRSRSYQRLAAGLHDAQTSLGASRRQPTFPSHAPLLRLDHIFVSRSIEVLKVETLRTPLARIASDHLPLLVDFRIRSREGSAAESGDGFHAGVR